MSRLVHVIFADDAKAWTAFLKDKVTRHRQPRYEFRSTPVGDLLKRSASSKRLSTEEPEVLLVILSPAHLAFLEKNPLFDYQGLVGTGQKGVLFFCGANEGQLERSDDLRSRFPWYSVWAKVDHSKADGLMDVVDGMPPFPRLTYQLIPSSVRCESGSMVTAAFSDVIASKSSDLQMSLYLAKDDDVNEEEELKVTWVNDKTVHFNAPERKEGRVRVRVLLDGNFVHGTEFLQYESSCELISDMMQLYIHSMNRLFCLILSKSFISTEDLDNLLFSIFDDEEIKEIQPKAFEEVFGIFRYNPKFKSQVELPTLLHLAKKFKLEKFESWLQNLPDADLAACIQNNEGLKSNDVNSFSCGIKTSHLSAAKPNLPSRQTRPDASDCLSQQLNADKEKYEEEEEEEDFYFVVNQKPKQPEKPDLNDDNEDDEDYLVMDKALETQSKKCEKPDMNNDDNNEDDEDYLVMDKALETQSKKCQKSDMNNDDGGDNEDDDDYLVMNKTVETQLNECEDEIEEENIYDLCNGDMAIEEDDENEVQPVTIDVKPITEATNLCNIFTDQLPSSMQYGQQRLIELMNQFKVGQLTMDEVNILFEEWKINNPQKQVRMADRNSTLQVNASVLPNFARRKTEYEIFPTKNRSLVSTKDVDSLPSVPPIYSVPENSSRNLQHGSVTLERHSLPTPSNKAGKTQNLRNSDGSVGDTMDGDFVRRISPNVSDRTSADAPGPPPLPARKHGTKLPPIKCGTLPTRRPHGAPPKEK